VDLWDIEPFYNTHTKGGNRVTGVSEILVLILLISGMLILPRMLKPPPDNNSQTTLLRLSKKKRAAIVASILFPIACAMIIKPWEDHAVLFAAIGFAPVAIAWAVYWILSAPKK
jgi:hypothetical protein